jgi:ABC-2 type transport system ATP-binding protein
MIEIQNLTKKYNDIIAVNNISLKIKQGEIFGLLGPNGAGKTTTLMMLSTLLKPDSGNAIVNGFDVKSNPLRVRESIGMVFQDPSSDKLLTAYENLKLHALLYNIPSNTIDKKIDDVLTLVDLKKRKYDQVKTFSGGMRRRMEIARGLMHEPKVFFLDEPTLGLDPQTREHIWEYIKSLAQKIGMTIILTTHYMEEAENLCDRIAIIDNGKIIALDSPFNLKHQIGGDIVILRGKKLNIDNPRLAFIKKIEKHEDYIKLCIENSGKNIIELLANVKNVDFIEVHPVDLNDVFLLYTGHAIRE